MEESRRQVVKIFAPSRRPFRLCAATFAYCGPPRVPSLVEGRMLGVPSGGYPADAASAALAGSAIQPDGAMAGHVACFVDAQDGLRVWGGSRALLTYMTSGYRHTHRLGKPRFRGFSGWQVA